MVMASGRWFGARVDLLASLLIAVVALAAVVVSQDAGGYILKTRQVKYLCDFPGLINIRNKATAILAPAIVHYAWLVVSVIL